MRKTIIALFALASIQFSGHAVTIAQWTFETSVPTAAGPISPELGSGTGTAFHANIATIYSNPAGNGSLESWSSDKWAIGDYYQFKLSTLGFQDIMVTWHQTRSGTGPESWDFAYSLDGVAFNVALDNYSVSAISWSSSGSPNALSIFSLSSLPASLENASEVYFRIIAESTPGGAGGTSRIDNFTVSGTLIPTSVPDPGSTAILLSIPLLGLWTLRRLSMRPV